MLEEYSLAHTNIGNIKVKDVQSAQGLGASIQTTGVVTSSPNNFGNTQFNVCPGCGRCNCCGRAVGIPYDPYGYPNITYPNGVNPYITWGATSQAAQEQQAAAYNTDRTATINNRIFK